MTPLPWELVAPHDSLFVLVTGANSGVGLAICKRLIDEFLESRSSIAHLVVIPTTRTKSKSAQTVRALRQYLKTTAEQSKKFKARSADWVNYEHPRDTFRRIHILSVQLDLCNLYTVADAARQLSHDGLSTTPFDDDFDQELFVPLVQARIPRLDSLVLNAGIGGWYDLSWLGMIRQYLTMGPLHAMTWPQFKLSIPGLVIDPLPQPDQSAKTEAVVDLSAEDDAGASLSSSKERPMVGEVFCANVLGHYMFARALMPLLLRTTSVSETANLITPGRIIWESSVEATREHFDVADLQRLKTTDAYESSKRLTDLLALSASSAQAKPATTEYFSHSADSKKTVTPKMYVAHPGITVTTIFPIHWILTFGHIAGSYFARWLGSPWHTVSTYLAATAMVWLVLADQQTLDVDLDAEHTKWGSSATFWGSPAVKRTEVGGWGWGSSVEDELKLKQSRSVGIMRHSIGRENGAVYATRKSKEEFLALGAQCWAEMERLRLEWEARINHAPKA